MTRRNIGLGYNKDIDFWSVCDMHFAARTISLVRDGYARLYR
jgi:hypothetical protein